MAATALAAAVLGATLAVPAAPGGAEGTGPDDEDLLGWVDLARAQSGLAGVAESPAATSGAAAHVAWLLANDTASHPECVEPEPDLVCTPLPGTSGGTVEGHSAGVSSLVMVSQADRTRLDAVRSWLTGPFHAQLLLSPRVGTVGFADAAEDAPPGQLRYAAALDLLTGFDRSPVVDAPYPLRYPDHGAVTAFTTYDGTELPDPLAPCPGYAAPTGAPIFVQLGDFLADRSAAPALEAFTFAEVDPSDPFDATPLPACAYDGTDAPSGYVNADPDAQAAGRRSLAGGGTVVIFPRDPLAVGGHYRYSVTAGGVTAGATFSVGERDEVAPPLPAPFPDVGIRHPFVDAIRWLADAGITTGLPDGTFGTTRPITRGQMAAFLYRAEGSPPAPPPTVSPFTDVPPTHDHYAAITWADEVGITTGFGDGTFRPGDAVTRKAMAAFLHRVAGAPPITPPTFSPFTDVDADDALYPSITWLAATGVTTGFTDGSFGPTRAVSRQSMAAFLYRFAHLVPLPV